MSQISKKVVWSSKAPKLSDFGALLNMLPDAAMLLDRKRDLIILANSSLLKLTAFTSDEVQGSKLIDHIIDIQIDELTPGEELSGMLNRRKRDPLPVNVQTIALDTDSQWLLVILLPLQDYQQIQYHSYERLLHGFLELAKSTCETDTDKLLKNVINVIKPVLETDLVCIYYANSSFPGFRRVSTVEASSVFPDTMPPTDYVHLSSTKTWMPGKLVSTDICRAGRVANLAYVLSTPLGENVATSGLLVAGYRADRSIENLENLLEFIGSYISGTLQHLLIIGDLRKERDEHNRQFTIHDTIVESAKEGILVLYPDLRVVEINPTAELMFGYANREVNNRLVDNLLIGPKDIIPAVEAACNGIPTHDAGNVSLLRRSGQMFPAQIQVIPVQKDGEVIAILIFVTDVSEHEQIRVRTQQLEHRAVLGEFTAVFAHEVRNPINNISTGLQLLASRLDSDDPNKGLINRMQSDCTRLNDLMESVLSFSRPIEHKFKPVNVSILLKRIVERWRPRMARVNVTPIIKTAEDLPDVMGDARSLEQVFTNLISNAVEVMNQTGGTLAIRAEKNNEIINCPRVEVSVSDNGPGIPDEICDHIFEPFVSNNPRGTGLGLAITKQIVTAHRGSIKVDTFPGGTIFHIFFPTINGD